MYEKVFSRMKRVLILTRFSSKTAKELSHILKLDLADTRRLLRSMVESNLIREGELETAPHGKDVKTYDAVKELINLGR